MTDEELPSWAKPHLETLKLVAAIGGDVAKIAAIISVPVSTFLLVRYLWAVEAPFPISASYTPTLLVVLATTFALVFFGFACTMAWIILQVRPFWSSTLRRDVPLLRSHAFPFKWEKSPVTSMDVSSRARWRRRRRRSTRRALVEYALVFPSFLIFWLCMAVGAIFKWQPSGEVLSIVFLFCLVVGAIASTGGFYLLRSRIRPDDDSILRSMRSIRFASVALAESLITFGSLLFFVALSDEIGRAEDTRSFGFLILFTILVVHASANISRYPPLTTIGILGLLLFFVISVPLGVPMYGGLSLRILGIGGGLAREITIRGYDIATGNPAMKVVKGCVLMKTGDEIAIHPVASRSECQLPRFIHDSMEHRPEWQVSVYPVSTIIETKSLILDAQQPK